MYDPLVFEPELIKAGEPRAPKPTSIFARSLSEALVSLEGAPANFQVLDFPEYPKNSLNLS